MPPVTPLAAFADRLLIESSPLPLVNHCYRTYAFGAELLRRQGRDFDDEVLYIASALHDLGLTETFDDGVTAFEAQGAQAAAEHLRSQGAPPELVALVQDAIALHLETCTADDPRPEVAGVTLGAAVDVLGLRLSDLDGDFVEEVLTRHPRAGLKAYLVDVLVSQAERKPGTLIAKYCRKLDFAGLVAAAPFSE